MTTVGAFAAALARRTRPDRAAAWDPVGLQLGDPAAPVGRVAVCHEVTERVVEFLIGEPPDLALTYHPLLFQPTSRLVSGPTPGGRAWRMARAGIGLAVTHTDFDSSPGGTADSLAAALGLADPEPFGPVAGREQVTVVTFVPSEAADSVAEAMAAAGAGTIGNYSACSFRTEGKGSFVAGEETDPLVGRTGEVTTASEVRLEMIASRSHEESVVAALMTTHPYEEPAYHVYEVRSNHGFIGRIGGWEGRLGDLTDLAGERLGRGGLRAAGDLDASVSRVAVVPGSGSSFIAAAAAAGADVLVTGDVDHHRAVGAKDLGMGVIDPGHAATELPGMHRLLEMVTEMGVEVIDLIGDGTGPWG